MSLLERFEQACAAFIERAFARSFPSDLAPAHAARKLVAVMEAHTAQEGAQLVAPSSYAVSVNPDDYERLASDRAYLEREWAELLRDLAGRVGATFANGEPVVTMLPQDGIPLGAVEIEVAAEPRFHLRVTKGVPNGVSFPVQDESSIGRDASAAIALADPSVSRRHAAIGLVDGFPVVRDLDSRNGTFVNGERVRTKRLAAGDVLRVGNTELLLEGVA